MNAGKLTILLIIVVSLALVLAGCPQLGVPGTSGADDGEDLEEFEPDPEASAQSVSDGKDALEDGDVDAALNSFAEALQLDPSNGEALVYYSTLSIATIVTEPDVARIARQYFGIQGYPTNFEEFFEFDWLTDTFAVTDTESGNPVFVASAMEAMYPEIEIPENIAGFSTEDPADNITNEEYGLALAYNFVTRNPEGLNAVSDDVIENVLGDRLGEVATTIEELPDGVQATIEWEFAYDTENDATTSGSWPTDSAGETAQDLVIGKAELLMATAMLRTITSRLYMTQAYSKALPLQNWWDVLNPVDNPEIEDDLENDDVPWGQLVTPFDAEFMFARDDYDSYLTNAKRSFEQAVGNIATATEEILSEREGFTLDGSDLYFYDSYMETVNSISWSDEIAPNMRYSQIAIGRIQDSVTAEEGEGGFAVFPVDAYNFDGPQEFFQHYSFEGNWPNQAEIEDIQDGDETYTVPSAVGINYAVPYRSPLGAINFLLDMNDGSGEPNYYEFDLTVDEIPYDDGEGSYLAPTYLANVSPFNSVSGINNPYMDTQGLYALRIPDITLNGLVDVDPFLDIARDEVNQANQDSDVTIGTPSGSLWDELVFENSDGSVSVYVPVIPPFLANESFTGAGQNVTIYWDLFEDPVEWETTGSFWWALGEMGINGFGYEETVEQF